jgi:phage terminase large subunit GpA-like protein
MTAPQPITLTGSRPWLPASLCNRMEDRTIRIRFSRPERKVYRKRKAIPVSEWCERHRVVTMSSLPGPWRNEVAQYLAGIMDASFFPSVRDITLCKAPQTGGSEAVNNCIAYAADRAPGPALYVYPDELTARENCQDRITPMFTSSARLQGLMSGRDDDAGALKLKLASMPIYMAWSRSASRLANKPIRYGVNDETDKYQDSFKSETDPLSLTEARLTTFRWSSKWWKISSPTVESGYIWQSMLAAQVIFEYVTVCPYCAGHQVMIFGDKKTPGGIRWPEDNRDPDAIELRELAWYECEHCRAPWNDYQRDKAVRAGYWRARGDGRELFAYLEAERPRKIAFHLPGWLSTFVSLSKVAAAFLRCKPDGKNLNRNAHKNFYNTFKAEPFLETHQEREEDKILALCDDRPRGLVPSGNRVACLLGTADTQDNGFYYKIRGWGYGLEQESWLIREGFVDSFEALEQVFWHDEYRDAAGKQYVLHFCAIDAMGHRTKEVYDWCRVRKGKIVPLKGEERMATPFSWSTIDTYPGTKKAIPGGVQLLRINTNYFKDNLATKLEIFPADPGAWHLHKDYTSDWAQQMCVEFVNAKGSWECPEGKANHAFDIEVYGLALADLVEVKFWKRPEEVETQALTPPRPAAPVRSQYMTR